MFFDGFASINNLIKNHNMEHWNVHVGSRAH